MSVDYSTSSIITKRTSYKHNTVRDKPQGHHTTLTAETRVNPDHEHCTHTTHINYRRTEV